MKRCLVIPDSFKGTMTSIEICNIMKGRILNYFPECEVITIPIADGGEGTVDCFLHALGGEKRFTRVKGPFFEELEAFYSIADKTAIIEIASVAGLSRAKDHLNPAKATTYGVGQLMEDAVHKGCKEIILGLGGSCTNDGGAGAAAALGTKFYNDSGESFIPTGENLGEIKLIDISATKEFLKHCTITVMCDVDNPLYGKAGAAYVFGPQKGADEETVRMLDEQLFLFSKAIKKSLDIEIGTTKGAGAAGGMGAGAIAFFDADMKKGIDMILDMIEFEDKIKDCDLIFTGEGKIDSQSLNGKAVIGVAKRAKEMNVPVIAVVGDVGEGVQAAYNLGVSAVFSTNQQAIPFETARKRCRKDLLMTMDNIVRFLKTIENFSLSSFGPKQ